MTWISDITELLWRGSWAVLPFALVVAAVCKWAPCRPGTRHTLWVVLLAAFLAPLISLVAPLPVLVPATTAALAPASENLEEIDEPASPVDLREYVVATPAFVVLPATFEENDVTASDAEPVLPPNAEPHPDVYWRPAPDARTTYRLVENSSQTPRKWRLSAPPTAQRVVVSTDGFSKISTTRDLSAITTSDVGAAEATKRTAPTNPAFSSDYGRHGGRPLDSAVDQTDAQVADRDSTAERWYAALIDVRGALTRLPALPAAFWFMGIAGMALLYFGGALRFRRRLARSEAAPKSVMRMVARLSRKMGLRAAPETVMLDAPISPMIWLGRRVLLVLPSNLWAQLDDVGRQAILCHELAHLRRRDHWVRWLELLLSALLWWNPLIWWVRRRVHEEADLCCDLWVTWLMPRRRRAYAEALLAAREHIRGGGLSTPSVAMGAATSNARKFTRRITMVMTQSSRPGLSLAGIGLACTLAIAGWIATPALGGPPKKASACAVTCDTPCQGKAVVVCETDGAKDGWISNAKTFDVALNSDDETAFYFISGDGEKKVKKLRRQKSAGDLDERLARLEQAVERLNKLLGHKDKAAERKAKALKMHLPALQAFPEHPALPALPAAPAAPKIWTDAGGKKFEFRVGDEDAHKDHRHGEGSKKSVARTYKLPKGKLKALTGLMVRQDVPILVSPQGDGIEVHATPKQHKIFKAFVNMIHPKGAKQKKAVSRTHSRLITSDDDGAVIRIETSDDEDADVRVIEIKDGKIYIDGEETDEHSGLHKFMIGDAGKFLGDDAHFYVKGALGHAHDEYMSALDEYGDAIDVLSDMYITVPEMDFDFDVDCDFDGQKLEEMIRGKLKAHGVWSDEIGEQIQKQLQNQIKIIELQAEELETQAEELEEQAELIEIHLEEVPEL